MIYEYPDAEQPIRQGDVFAMLPRVDISLKTMLVIDEGSEPFETTWTDIIANEEEITAILPVRSVTAIVATQDCDAVRSRDITLCEIRTFSDVEGISKGITSPEKWMKILIRQAKVNQKWFYLPPDERIGFAGKMGVDFLLPIRVPRKDLEDVRHLRKGRLSDLAEAHFRERIGEFFRRYAYDEWYPLNREEFVAYEKDHPGSKPFNWQKARNSS